jgi:hypothetical protein
MRELMTEFKELRLHGMAGAWEELASGGGTGIETSRWLIEHLLQAEHTDRVMRSISYQMHAARFPVHRDLAGFDFAQAKVDEKLIRQLADLSLPRKHITWCSSAAPGLGRRIWRRRSGCRASATGASGCASSQRWSWSTPWSWRRRRTRPGKWRTA